jgi:rfaE bifunctional protein kinase chain/domain
VRRLQAVIISDYRKGTVTTELSNQVTVLARLRCIPVSVDPKPEHPEICRHAAFASPNLHEAELMAHAPLRNRHDLETAGQRLRAELGCSCLLLTRGSEGMMLFEPNRAGQESTSLPRLVCDVTGAGDTALATLALPFVSGVSMLEAAQLANLAASRVVLKSLQKNCSGRWRQNYLRARPEGSAKMAALSKDLQATLPKPSPRVSLLGGTRTVGSIPLSRAPLSTRRSAMKTLHSSPRSR